MLRGQAFWRDITLPGEQSGGNHVCVVISDDDYNERTQQPVLAALRNQRPNGYRVPVRISDYQPNPGSPPLDRDRVFGLDQCVGIASSELGVASGIVAPAVIERVQRAVPRQFQLEGPWKQRGDVYEFKRVDAPFSRIILVVNDAAIGHPAQQQVLGLPYEDEPLDSPLLLVGRFELGAPLFHADQQTQARLSRIVKSMFAV